MCAASDDGFSVAEVEVREAADDPIEDRESKNADQPSKDVPADGEARPEILKIIDSMIDCAWASIQDQSGTLFCGEHDNRMDRFDYKGLYSTVKQSEEDIYTFLGFDYFAVPSMLYHFIAEIDCAPSVYRSIDFLDFMSTLGYGKAHYFKGKLYGCGMVYERTVKIESKSGFSSYEDTTASIELDEHKMVESFQNALDCKYPCLDAALDLGVYYMDLGKDGEAKKYLELAVESGIKDADVYLNYLNNIKYNGIRGWDIRIDPDTSPAYDTDRHRGGLNPDFCVFNVQEYNGYLYFVHPEDTEDRYYNKNGYTISRISVTGGDDAVQKLATASGGAWGYWQSMRDVNFSICDDQIYFSDENGDSGISVMNLDGSNRRSFTFSCNKKKIKSDEMPIALPKFILYAYGGTLYKYEYGSGEVTKLHNGGNKPEDVWGISEKEVNYKNETIVDIATNTSKKVWQVYPLLKKHKESICYIDMAHEIAYHYEIYSEEAGRNYMGEMVYHKIKSRVIGSNKVGEVVDIWNLPRISAKFLEVKASGTLLVCRYCFDCRGLSGHFLNISEHSEEKEKMRASFWMGSSGNKKMLEEESRLHGSYYSFMCAFDRLGNGRIFHSEQRYESRSDQIGGFFANTESGVISLQKVGANKGPHGHWSNEYWFGFTHKFDSDRDIAWLIPYGN